MIIARDNPNVEIQNETYPPDDARAMSPRRSISDTEKLGEETRASVKRYVVYPFLVTSSTVTPTVPKRPRWITTVSLPRDDWLLTNKSIPSSRQARSLQSGLNALAERIEQVKADHEKLEKQNLALQDYIGGLTRSMSATNTGLASSTIKAKK